MPKNLVSFTDTIGEAQSRKRQFAAKGIKTVIVPEAGGFAVYKVGKIIPVKPKPRRKPSRNKSQFDIFK